MLDREKGIGAIAFRLSDQTAEFSNKGNNESVHFQEMFFLVALRVDSFQKLHDVAKQTGAIINEKAKEQVQQNDNVLESMQKYLELNQKKSSKFSQLFKNQMVFITELYRNLTNIQKKQANERFHELFGNTKENETPKVKEIEPEPVQKFKQVLDQTQSLSVKMGEKILDTVTTPEADVVHQNKETEEIRGPQVHPAVKVRAYNQQRKLRHIHK